jgi:chitodextrinase
VQAFDAAGNRSSVASLAATTSACADSEPPTAPTGLAASGGTLTSLNLSWSRASDNVGVTGYDLYSNGTRVASTTGTSYSFSGLVCGTSYTLGVAAYDAAGNVSTRSTASGSTVACTIGGTAPAFRFAYFGDADPVANKNLGATLIDVGSKSSADSLPAGLQGMVWLGDYDNTACGWQVSDSSLSSTVTAAKGDPKVYGWFFSDEPNPVTCPNAPAQHKARSDLIHSIDPNTKTFVVLDSNGFSGNLTPDAINQIPLWVGSADFIGLDPYPCLVNKSCNYTFISNMIAKADATGVPYVGVLQAFDGTAAGEQFRQPTASELQTMVNLWAASHEAGSAYFAWDWPAANWYLSAHPDLESVIQGFYTGSSSSDTTPPTPPGTPTVTGATGTSLALMWSPSLDSVGVAGYDLYLNGGMLGSTTGTTYTYGGLTCGTTYTLGVVAFDGAGNRSAQSTVGGSTGACSTGTTDPVVVAAGDICGSPTDCTPTANLIGSIDPTAVLTLGDNAYTTGSASDYSTNYDPNWGKYKSITKPAPGNHEYDYGNQSTGYFAYFNNPSPYYSYDIGSWHLISLNGELGASAGSAQETWLKNDLAAHTNTCTLAYWHEPRWSSGYHGGSSYFGQFWTDLYSAGADVVLNGHDHDYERFAPQDPSGHLDTTTGIREFVSGTGGDSHYTFNAPSANSEIRDSTSFGVLKLTLHTASYDWKFVPVSGASFTDAGTAGCH